MFEEEKCLIISLGAQVSFHAKCSSPLSVILIFLPSGCSISTALGEAGTAETSGIFIAKNAESIKNRMVR